MKTASVERRVRKCRKWRQPVWREESGSAERGDSQCREKRQEVQREETASVERRVRKCRERKHPRSVKRRDRKCREYTTILRRGLPKAILRMGFLSLA